jgi:mono/diheme cytochrome c family protein
VNRTRIRASAGWLLTAVAVSAVAVAVAAQKEPPLIERGVYTQAQAERGKASYATHCSECHGGDLGGTSFGDGVPALKRDDFKTGQTLKAVFDEVKRAMPFNAPGSLADAVYLDVIAYVLRENGYPAGGQELASDADLLKRIVIVPRR